MVYFDFVISKSSNLDSNNKTDNFISIPSTYNTNELLKFSKKGFDAMQKKVENSNEKTELL